MQLEKTIIDLVAEIYKLASASASPLLISVAESCTGRMLASYIISVPGYQKISGRCSILF